MDRKDWVAYRFMGAGIVLHSGTVSLFDGEVALWLAGWAIGAALICWGCAGLSTLRDDSEADEIRVGGTD